MNACVDTLEQFTSRLEQAYNSTYPLKLMNQSVYEDGMFEWSRPDGLRDRLVKCKALAAEKDPDDTGANEEVNAFCGNATETFAANLERFLGAINVSIS